MSCEANEHYIECKMEKLFNLVEDGTNLFKRAIKLAREDELDDIYELFKDKYPELLEYIIKVAHKEQEEQIKEQIEEENMEITNTGYDLSNMIDTIVARQISAIKETADSEAFFEWMKQEIFEEANKKRYQDRSPMEPEVNKWIKGLLENGIKCMIENVIEGHKLVMKEENGKN